MSDETTPSLLRLAFERIDARYLWLDQLRWTTLHTAMVSNGFLGAAAIATIRQDGATSPARWIFVVLCVLAFLVNVLALLAICRTIVYQRIAIELYKECGEALEQTCRADGAQGNQDLRLSRIPTVFRERVERWTRSPRRLEHESDECSKMLDDFIASLAKLSTEWTLVFIPILLSLAWLFLTIWSLS